MPISDSEIFSKKGNTLSAAYPNFNHAWDLYSGYRMGTREFVRASHNILTELASDTRRADLDLFSHLDLQERRIDGLVDKRDKDLKTINENFRLHRDFIDGMMEQQKAANNQIAELHETIAKQGRTIEVLKSLLKANDTTTESDA